MMLVLALLSLQPPALPEPVELPRHAYEPVCGGGRFVFFEPGSDRLGEEGRTRLRQWAEWLRQSGPPGHIEVEANADGSGSTYDRELSLRRAALLRQILVENGLGDRDIEIRLQDWFGREAGWHEAEIANVRLKTNEAPVLNDRGYPIISECF